MPSRISFSSLSIAVLAMLFLAGCQALNPVCLTARPVPVLTSLSPSSATLAQTQQSFVLTVNGSHFDSASVVMLNGAQLSTTFVSDVQLKATFTATSITATGMASVLVHTPSNLAGDLGCNSGGNSAALILTIT